MKITGERNKKTFEACFIYYCSNSLDGFCAAAIAGKSAFCPVIAYIPFDYDSVQKPALISNQLKKIDPDTSKENIKVYLLGMPWCDTTKTIIDEALGYGMTVIWIDHHYESFDMVINDDPYLDHENLIYFLNTERSSSMLTFFFHSIDKDYQLTPWKVNITPVSVTGVVDHFTITGDRDGIDMEYTSASIRIPDIIIRIDDYERNVNDPHITNNHEYIRGIDDIEEIDPENASEWWTKMLYNPNLSEVYEEMAKLIAKGTECKKEDNIRYRYLLTKYGYPTHHFGCRGVAIKSRFMDNESRDMFDELIDDYDIAIQYYNSSKTHVYKLYTSSKSNVDLQEISKKYSGISTKHSCTFITDTTIFRNLSSEKQIKKFPTAIEDYYKYANFLHESEDEELYND